MDVFKKDVCVCAYVSKSLKYLYSCIIVLLQSDDNHVIEVLDHWHNELAGRRHLANSTLMFVKVVTII